MWEGSIHTWLVQVLRHIDRSRFCLDFVVHTNREGYYHAEVRSLGAKIMPCLNYYQPWWYQQNLQRILKENGPYDIIHTHIADYSGWVMRVAYKAGVPIRIPHSHNNPSHFPGNSQLYWRFRLMVMRRWLRKYSTHFLAVSQDALAMFGADRVKHRRYYILNAPPIFQAYHEKVDSAALRNSLHIPPEAPVIGHVGRFCDAKNHFLILEIAKEMAKNLPQARFLLIGDGPLRSAVEAKAHALGLGDQVIFAGFRKDVPRLLLGALDLFLFPSLYEGLGLALVEAQAAGLPCVYSDIIPKEADVVPLLLHRLSLNSSIPAWADAIRAALNNPHAISQQEALRMVEKKFNIVENVKELERIYTIALNEAKLR
ncbi:MAG: glycosyltransferase [Desulfobacca sp.]|nr:glycosyltransferase [Desulfobacca sp.]